jgi:hypothetical protein
MRRIMLDMRRSRHLVLTAAVLVAATALGGCASRAHQASDQPTTGTYALAHGSLTTHEFNVAVALARAEADETAIRIDSATATAADGTETEANAGPPCTSGKLLHIKLIGAFNIVHGGPLGASDDPVTAVLMTADPESAKSCLISVATGTRTPDPGSTVLFTSWRP